VWAQFAAYGLKPDPSEVPACTRQTHEPSLATNQADACTDAIWFMLDRGYQSQSICLAYPTSGLGMTVRIWVLSHLWILHLTDVGLGVFLYPWSEPKHDSYIIGFRCRLHFFTRGRARNLKKTLKLERKNPKTRKKPEKTWNLKKNFKPKRNLKTTERNLFTKPDGHPNPIWNPMGSGAKFHPQV
jgi:hypothetical protein